MCPGSRTGSSLSYSCLSSHLERNSMSPRKLFAALCLCFALSFAARSSAQTKLLRFPDVHGDKVVFTYAGDLWLAPTSGSQASSATATRLTAHPGVELF